MYMSWGTCYSGSDNIHYDFPSIMNDGRLFTNWQPGTEENVNLKKYGAVDNNKKYRKYLVENADSIIKYNQETSFKNTGFAVSLKNVNNNNPRGPFLFKDPYDKSQPYGYETSDLKNMYLTKTALQSKMFAPVFKK